MTVASARTTRGRGGVAAVEVDPQAVDTRAVGARAHRLHALRLRPSRRGLPPGHERPEDEVVAVRGTEVRRRSRSRASSPPRRAGRRRRSRRRTRRRWRRRRRREGPSLAWAFTSNSGRRNSCTWNTWVCWLAGKSVPAASSCSDGRAQVHRGGQLQGEVEAAEAAHARVALADLVALRVAQRPGEAAHRRRQRLDVAARARRRAGAASP